MSANHTAVVVWRRQPEEAFLRGRYSRAHRWRFDGGAEVAASASPHIVPLPYSDPAGVDPEEAFIAALSSCHMLFFLDFASRAGFVVEAYEDRAEGEMGGEVGRARVAKVTLRPQVVFGGEKRPGAAEVESLHHRAHEACFIANSVTSEIRIEGGAEGLASD